MKRDEITALPDAEIEQIMAWGQEEQRLRAERRKSEAIARIKELAATVGIGVAIQGQRGRPVRMKPIMTEKRTEETGKTGAVKHAR